MWKDSLNVMQLYKEKPFHINPLK